MSKLGTISCTVEVPVTERELIVVVARVEVPVTIKSPETLRLPPILCPPVMMEVPT